MPTSKSHRASGAAILIAFESALAAMGVPKTRIKTDDFPGFA